MDRTTGAGERRRRQRHRRRRVLGHDRADLQRFPPVAGEHEAGNPGGTGRDHGPGRPARAEVAQQRHPSGAERAAVERLDRRPVPFLDRPHRDVRARRGLDDPLRAPAPRVTPPGIGSARFDPLRAQALQAVHRLEPERAVHPPPGIRRIQHRRQAESVDPRHAMGHQRRRDPAPAVRGGHQHHADPGERPVEGQRKRGGGQPAARIAHADRLAQGHHQAPVGSGLVPPRLRRKRHRRGYVRDAERHGGEPRGQSFSKRLHEPRSASASGKASWTGAGKLLSKRLHEPRSASPCRGSACRARPSRPSSRSSGRAGPPDSRTGVAPPRC